MCGSLSLSALGLTIISLLTRNYNNKHGLTLCQFYQLSSLKTGVDEIAALFLSGRMDWGCDKFQLMSVCECYRQTMRIENVLYVFNFLASRRVNCFLRVFPVKCENKHWKILLFQLLCQSVTKCPSMLVLWIEFFG